MKIKTLCFFMVVSMPLFAGTHVNKTIANAHVNIGSGYFFKVADGMVDNEECGSAGWYKLSNGTYTKEAFSIVLAAKMSGKKVNFHLDGCSSGYPKVEWINVHEG